MARRPRIAATLRQRIVELDGQRCAYCRGPMVVGIPMVVEHIVPLIAGRRIDYGQSLPLVL